MISRIRRLLSIRILVPVRILVICFVKAIKSVYYIITEHYYLHLIDAEQLDILCIELCS